VKLTTSAKVSIASNVIALGAVALSLAGVPAAPPLDYAVHKFLHLCGVVMFMGNLIAGPLWVALAWSSNDPKQLAISARALVTADIYLTAPGVQLAVWNGVCMVGALGGVGLHPWLKESLALLVVTSLLACTVILYFQEQFYAAAQREDAAATRAALLRWGIWGTVISLPFTWIAWLMVAKRPAVF